MVERRRKSRLPERVQEDLIREFVAGATARRAANLVGVNRHTATLYFHKLLELIALKLAETEPWLSGEVEVTKSILVAPGKGSSTAARLVKFRYSGCSRKAARCTSSSSTMPNKLH